MSLTDGPDRGPTQPEVIDPSGGANQTRVRAYNERLVMSLYYSDGLNLKEIGAVLKVTESRVCQLHGQALVRLKARLADWRDGSVDERA